MAGIKLLTGREKKEADARLKREGVLATHIRNCSGPLNIDTLARSYALPVERVREILKRHGGVNG